MPLIKTKLDTASRVYDMANGKVENIYDTENKKVVND